MTRRPRQQSQTGVYHVMTRGLNKLPVFKEAREMKRVYKLISENLSKYGVELYAYCIMSNHFHLLVKASLTDLSSFMAKILAEYARYYNYKHERVGYVFQGRFKSQCVESESYFWNCLRYIHRNPAKVVKAEDLLNYRYSSLGEFYYEKTKLIHGDVLDMKRKRFATSQEFLDFHRVDSRDIFTDVEEEMEQMYLRIAKEILAEIQRRTGEDAREVLEYIEIRKKYEQLLVEALHISSKKAQDIEARIREELIGTG